MTQIPPFHLAFPVHDIEAARAFYGGILQCEEGRSDSRWVDFNLYGHQIVTHFSPESSAADPHCNPVDGHAVPVPHFGVVLPWDEWEALADRLRDAGMYFVIAPGRAIRGSNRRTGDHVLPGPVRKRAGIQGLS